MDRVVRFRKGSAMEYERCLRCNLVVISAYVQLRHVSYD